MTVDDFIAAILRIAQEEGYKIETSARNGLPQVNFGKKKLHAGHFRKLYPAILAEDAHIPTLINAVAPGRPCSHEPMRKIIEAIKLL